MHVLAIDVGSYSVKYISSFVDKRKINHVEMSEIILSDYLSDREGLSLLEGQISIVQEIIDSTARHDTKIIFQADNEMMTTRFLTLPVKSKKKAEQMLPFQLEEDIPYALSEIHFSYRMEAQKTQHYALVELVRNSAFEDYFLLLKEKNALPNILTSEASTIENYFNQNSIAGPFCVLDIGHKTTKAYFFYNSRLIVTHVSYMGGKDINEMIAQTYKIDPEEAVFYKHQNAFLLTSSQYDEVEPAQKEFATAMDKVFKTLVADFSRWKIGFKVNYGLSLGHIFICGGSSNIKNIANYLTEKWDTKVALLETFDKVDGAKVDLNPKAKSKFAIANMMAVGFRRKNRFINLLTGDFAQASSSELPLHSFGFISVRVAGVFLVLLISLITEWYFLNSDIKAVNVALTKIVKHPDLNLPRRLERNVGNRPGDVLDKLTQRQKGIRQEISTLQAAIEIQALAPLVVVSQIVAGAQSAATMIEFKSNENKELSIVFTADSVEDLKKVKTAFEASTLEDVRPDLLADEKRLKITAIGI